MPLIDPVEETTPEEKPTVVRIAAPKYKGVVVDTRYQPASDLLTHVEGSSWTVNYYSQVLDDDNDLSGQNVNLNPIYQQYKLIRGMELKVTTGLTTSQDDTTKAISLTGAANVYPFLIPNEGDMFLADVGDGREGIFRITLSERKAIFKDTCYAVEYLFVDYSTDTRRADLNTKTVQTVQFYRDFLLYGQNPLLFEEDYAVLQTLQSKYRDMVVMYFKSFTSNEFKTLILPGQEQATYDHFAVKAITSYFTTTDAMEKRQIRIMNCDDDYLLKATNVWDVLTTRDTALLKVCMRRVGLVSARMFERQPMMEGVFYSGLKELVYPKDAEVLVDYELLPRNKTLSDNTLKSSQTHIATMADLFSQTELDGLQLPDDDYAQAPMIGTVGADDYYIFSEAFYTRQRSNMSRLELTVWDYLDGKALNNKLLLSFCDAFYTWGSLERFYFIPIVLILIRSSIRSI